MARQASEQYRTASQFLAQALRQDMVRPHTTQSLLGRDCLLPLKSFFIRMGVASYWNRSPCDEGVAGALAVRLDDVAGFV